MIESVSADIPLLDAAKLSAFRARLVNKGGRRDEKEVEDERQELVKQVLAPNNDFMNWFGQQCPPDGDTPTIRCTMPVTGVRLSEREIAGPPLSTEKMLSGILAEVAPRQAALPAFWASYNLELLRRGVVEVPSHFAKPVGSGPAITGRETLERALDGESKQLDATIRTLCRQMLGGVPEERGQVSVYLDPRIARAWWRGRVVQQAVSDLDLDVDVVWETLRLTGAPWEELVQHMVRKLTHVGERSIRSALVARFVEMRLVDDDAPTRRKRTMELLAATGQCVARQSLGMLTAREVLDVLRRF